MLGPYEIRQKVLIQAERNGNALFDKNSELHYSERRGESAKMDLKRKRVSASLILNDVSQE